MKDINVDALFLGPKSENQKFLKEMIEFMLDEHIFWRRDFHPEDKEAITLKEQSESSFQNTLEKTREVLLELSSKLKRSSEPWFSPRYLGQMNSDVLMPAVIAYMATILYNPNNCAYEGAPATTSLEVEVGKQLSKMMGYDPEKAWGHVTSGGHVANFEATWFMRNLKSVPNAIKKVKPELVKGLDDWQLMNLSTTKILDLLDETKELGIFDEVRNHSVRGTGMISGKFGKLLVPQTKHYSWTKVVDIMGIGSNNFVNVQVNDKCRMDINHLKEEIDKLVEQKIPVLGVVSVVGTTEEGAVDEVHEVVKLRKEYEKKGISFYYHIDAAYGGYARSIFLDKNDEFVSYDKIKPMLHESGAMQMDNDWPSRDIYEAYKAMSEADSITTDPHKMGYIPYQAGAILAKDTRVKDLISYFAAYVFAQGMSNENPILLGSYIMEGSKAGASVAAVWAAHKVVPLNISGYGRIIGRSQEVAQRFYKALSEEPEFTLENGKTYKTYTLTEPDFNMVNWTFNEVGNTSLKKMNDLTLKLFDKFQYVGGPVYSEDFLTSHTEFTLEDYGKAPVHFLNKIGIDEQEFLNGTGVWIFRASLLTPFLNLEKDWDNYWAAFMKTVKKTILEVD